MAGEAKCTIITAAQVITGDVIQPDAEPGDIKVTHIERKSGNGRMRVKINGRFEMDGDQNVILASREVDSSMLRKLMECAAALFKNRGVEAEWFLTCSDELGGRAPLDFLKSSQDFEFIIQFIQNLRVFELVCVSPGELAVFDGDGYAVCSLTGKALEAEKYLAPALDWLLARGWHVVSTIEKLGGPKTWCVLVRQKQ